jgi:hypothetical protein
LLRGAALLRRHPAARALPDAQRDWDQHLGGAAAGADQLRAVLMSVGAGRHLEQHLAVADDATHVTFSHGFLLFAVALADASSGNYPDVIWTLPRTAGNAEEVHRRVVEQM